MRSKKKPAPPCQAATGLSLMKLQLANYKMEDSSSAFLRQVPIGAIRLANRFGLSVSAAQAIAEANQWGGR